MLGFIDVPHGDTLSNIGVLPCGRSGILDVSPVETSRNSLRNPHAPKPPAAIDLKPLAVFFFSFLLLSFFLYLSSCMYLLYLFSSSLL
jgi:hypothetical protein